MAGITALGTTYNLPNYTGILYQLTPADTPFFSAIGGLTGGGQSTDTEFEWSTFDLRAAAQPAVLEGQDAPTEQERVRAQIKNVTQIHQETIGVSYTKQAAVGRKAGLANDATNPVRSEVDWQTEQMLKQMARDIDYSFINGTYQLPTDNTTARKTRGLLAAITSNTFDVSAGASKSGAAATTDIITLASHGQNVGDLIVFTNIGTAVGVTVGTNYYVIADSFTTGQFKVATTRGGTAVDITTAGTVVWPAYAALSKALVDQMLQTVYDAGGITESGMATLLVGSAQRRDGHSRVHLGELRHQGATGQPRWRNRRPHPDRLRHPERDAGPDGAGQHAGDRVDGAVPAGVPGDPRQGPLLRRAAGPHRRQGPRADLRRGRPSVRQREGPRQDDQPSGLSRHGW
jgi:hypothetical protein